MIFQRYGSTVRSVEPDFDSRALTEIVFRRDRETSIPVDEFFRRYEKEEERELTAESEGPVQDEAQQALLEDLEGQIEDLLADLDENRVLFVESEQGKDYPKTRDRRKDVVVEGENRLYFYCRVEPPLRIGIYREKD